MYYIYIMLYYYHIYCSIILIKIYYVCYVKVVLLLNEK